PHTTLFRSTPASDTSSVCHLHRRCPPYSHQHRAHNRRTQPTVGPPSPSFHCRTRRGSEKAEANAHRLTPNSATTSGRKRETHVRIPRIRKQHGPENTPRFITAHRATGT